MTGVRVISEALGGSPLSLAVQTRDARLASIQRFAPRSGSDWAARAAAVRTEFAGGAWAERLAAAFGGGMQRVQRLQRAARNDGVVITTGQQPGLFGGPLYTWIKALSTLALADAVEARTGVPAAPVFWAATDDTDWAEAASTVIATDEGERVLRMRSTVTEDGTAPMSAVPLPSLHAELAALRAASGSGAGSPVLESVARCYSEGHTVGSAYVDLLRLLLEPLGIAVLDAAHSATRAAAHPLLRRALDEEADVQAALHESERELRRLGFVPQVTRVEGRSLVFAWSGDGGRAVRQRVASREAAEVAGRASPADLSPSVLLRPVTERFILPTLAYVAGPGELAYFAQAAAVARALRVDEPVAVPRWSAMVIEPRIQRILDRRSIPAAALAERSRVEERIGRGSLDPRLRAALEALGTTMDDALLRVADADAELVVPRAVLQGARGVIARRVERLERRYVAAGKRRASEAMRDVATASAALYPLGGRQERALNILPWLARYGDELLAAMLDGARSHAATLLTE